MLYGTSESRFCVIEQIYFWHSLLTECDFDPILSSSKSDPLLSSSRWDNYELITVRASSRSLQRF